ncbi:hypothetical protein [Vibrio taketomensis]|uniref:hypothetical protein n=1 Tax=Vibrio taketomensis TaxID=2572923 RepID=UPI001389AD3A|nr:hypothetical protein [Vibrio taketomensis]
MRLIGMLSAVCLTLLLTTAADDELLPKQSDNYTAVHQLQSFKASSIYSIEAKRHANPLHTLISRNIQKPTERQGHGASFLPVSDSIYAQTNSINGHYYRQYDVDVALRVKQHYESNLIYRFIHSRHTPQLV